MKRLGKLPAKHDPRNLRFARYLVKLPAPPPSIDHASLVQGWPMYGNDRYGSCGPAGAGHQIQSWSTYGLNAQLPTTNEILSAYFAITGGQDTGVYLTDMLNYWRNVGIARDLIEAYVQVNPNLDEARLTIQHFGSLGVGMSLPDENTFGPWIEPTGPPNPYNGHYVCAVGYDDTRQMFKVVTWGELWDMSYAWFLRYCDEAFAVLNDLELIRETMTSPEGFDWNQLQDDLQHLGDPIDPLPPVPGPGGCLGRTLGRLAAWLNG